jgi:hypothetical protein
MNDDNLCIGRLAFVFLQFVLFITPMELT